MNKLFKKYWMKVDKPSLFVMICSLGVLAYCISSIPTITKLLLSLNN